MTASDDGKENVLKEIEGLENNDLGSMS